MALVDLPRRDAAAVRQLADVAGRVRPFVPAGDRLIPVAGPLGEALPSGGVRRGVVVAVDGALGAGATTVALTLASAVTALGEWGAFVDPRGTLGGRAAAEVGVVLERFAVVRHVPADQWATVVAALIDGFAFVAAPVPEHCRLGDARRLVAKARERSTIVVALGSWPAEASVRVRANASTWRGLGNGEGLLATRDVDLEVAHRGMPIQARLRAG